MNQTTGASFTDIVIKRAATSCIVTSLLLLGGCGGGRSVIEHGQTAHSESAPRISITLERDGVVSLRAFVIGGEAGNALIKKVFALWTTGANVGGAVNSNNKALTIDGSTWKAILYSKSDIAIMEFENPITGDQLVFKKTLSADEQNEADSLVISLLALP